MAYLFARKDFNTVLEVVLTDTSLRKVWMFVGGGKAVIRATRRIRGREGLGELLVTYGAPNYAEARRLAGLKRRGEAVPTHVHLVYWPARKAVRKAA